MKKLLEKLRAAEEEATAAGEAWEKDPENEELETRFDDAYRAQIEARNNLVNKIIIKTDRTISRAEIDKMLLTRREQLEDIILKLK